VLDAEKSRDLIKSGLDYIIFAFDGASPEVFEQYRVGANFHKVRANILNFLKVKKEMKSRIFCIVQMVRMKGNAHEIGAFKRLWSVEGVDKIRVKEDEVRQHAAALSAPEVFLERPACQILWRGPMYVRYDGEAFPCCYAFREESLGNLKTQSLAELWNSSQMQAMRAAHKRRDLRAYRACQTCQARQPSLPLLMGSFLVDSLQVQKLIPAYEKLSFLSNFSANP
jgi:radical SAM protein with 4Fe4S-binding SPASM domain